MASVEKWTPDVTTIRILERGVQARAFVYDHRPRKPTVEQQVRRELDRLGDRYPELAQVVDDWLNFAEPALIADRLPSLLAELVELRVH